MLFFEPKSRKDLIKEPSKLGLAIFTCLGLAFISVLWLGIYSLLNYDQVQAFVGKQIIAYKIANTGLPLETQKKLNIQVRRLSSAFEEKKISAQDLKDLKAKLSSSPLAPIAAAKMIQANFLAKSHLKPAEVKAGRIIFQRLTRGLYEKKISKQAVKKIAKPFFIKTDVSLGSIEDPKNQRGGALGLKLRNDVSASEVSQFLAQALTLADKAKIPNQPLKIDLADELEKEIDQMLALVDKKNRKANRAERPNHAITKIKE